MNVKSRLRKLTIFAIAIFVATVTTLAQAGAPLKNVFASGCSPENWFDYYALENVEGAWQFRGKHKRRATLICSVDTLDILYKGSMVIVYGDSDGAGTKTGVKINVEYFDGAMVNNFGTYDSNDYAAPGLNVAEILLDSSEGGVWYFRVDFSRNSSAENSAFYYGVLTD